MTSADPIAEAALFEVEQPPPVSLADKFGVPPMSVLDRRSGEWQDRKRAWLSLGMTSDDGRGDALTFARSGGLDPVSQKLLAISPTSVFDPVLCELAYRWFSRPGAVVLDPFAGGSVRGLVASTLARWYYGVDIRPEQVAANCAQADIASDITPTWLVGDATRLHETTGLPDEVDLVFSCPPYADLEVYSDDPRDISTWPYELFVEGHAKAIRDAVSRLRPDRYAVWVIGDVRDPRSGAYRGLVAETARAFRATGCHFLNEFITVDMAPSAGLRAERPFVANRKATKVHQNLLVFVKGDIRRAAQWVTA
jgi:hypothetical protein